MFGPLCVLPCLDILKENYRVSKCLQKFKLMSPSRQRLKDLLRPSQSCDTMTFHEIKSMIKPKEL